MSQNDRSGPDKRRRNSVAPNPWRRGRRRPQPHDAQPGSELGRYGPSSRHPMVAALFDDASHAGRAHALLFDRGYRYDEIVVAMTASKWEHLFGPPERSTGEGAALARNGQPAGSGDAGQPVPLAIGPMKSTTRVMAAGRIAALLAHVQPSRGDDALERVLVDCGIAPRNASACASAVEAGKILLAVVPRSDADAEVLREEWSRESGSIPDR